MKSDLLMMLEDCWFEPWFWLNVYFYLGKILNEMAVPSAFRWMCEWTSIDYHMVLWIKSLLLLLCLCLNGSITVKCFYWTRKVHLPYTTIMN